MTESRETGGWAFPQPLLQHNNGEVYGAGGWDHFNGGMTLRDWFAGQALAGMLAHGQGPNTAWHDHLPSAAQWAYEFADAMIEARGK